MANRRSIFSKHLQTPAHRNFEFHFDEIHSKTSEKFLVSVFHENKRITFFHMQKKETGWKIINAPKVADEFLQLEASLALAIKAFELNNKNRLV